jgi:hypothetical protein
MDKAIIQIKQLIQYHENQRDEYLDFFDTDKYKSQLHQEADTQLVKDHTNKIYADLIHELNRAIAIIEKYGDVIIEA